MFRKISFKSNNLKKYIAAIFCLFLLLLLFARGGKTSADKFSSETLTCEPGQWESSIYYSGDKFNCPDLIEFYLVPSFVNEKSSELVNRVVTVPSGSYGTADRNSGFSFKPFTVDIDTVDIKRVFNPVNEVTVGINSRSKMSTKNTLFYYPFDFYNGEISLQATDFQSKSPIPSTISVDTQSLSGWILNYSQKGTPEVESKNKIIYSDGLAKITWELKRANVIFIAIFLLIFLMITALISVYTLTSSISNGRRPPSMNLLLWLATILFAIVQVRSNFPGNPPLGILIDYIIVFPVLSLLLLLGIANTFYWLARPDWDFENEKSI